MCAATLMNQPLRSGADMSVDRAASSSANPGKQNGPPGPGTAPGPEPRPLAVVENEFASVTVSLDTAGHSPRLRVQDNESGDWILLSAVELASFCQATSEDRLGWLRVGLYREAGK
jgi:hypothetical protein